MTIFVKANLSLPTAFVAAGLSLVIGAAAASAAPSSDVYRDSATGPNDAPISQRLEVVRAPEPGRATATERRLKTVIRRTTKRTDVVEAPRTGRGRM